MKSFRKLGLTSKIILGLVLGIIAGFIVPDDWTLLLSASDLLGTIYMNALKMMIYPLVFCSIIVGIDGIGSISATGKIAGRAMMYFLTTTFFACIFGVFVPQSLGIGKGAQIAFENSDVSASSMASILDTIKGLIPSNPIQSFANGDMLPILVFAVIMGLTIISMGEKAKPVKDVIFSLNEISMKIVLTVMEFTPLGVFFTIMPIIASNGMDTIMSVAQALATCYVVIIVYSILVYGGFVRFVGKKNPIWFLKNIMPAALNAFGTCSSSATLPISKRCAEKGLGVTNKITSIVLPLGATINMDAISILMSIMITFFANACGIHLTLSQMAVIVLSNVLLSIGTPGIPNGQVASFAALIGIAGLPSGVMSIFISVSTLSDMIVTTADVLGDLTCCTVLNHILKYDSEESYQGVINSCAKNDPDNYYDDEIEIEPDESMITMDILSKKI